MQIKEELLKIIPSERIKTQIIDTLTYASDAGFYKLIPQAIVQPIDNKEIKDLFSFSHKHNIPITFRAGGTSLSGQSITDGILVDISRFWRNVEIIENGNFIKVQPGVIGSIANAHLKKYKRKIGPDPSSITSAMMGGILSNNSSGMCCGVAQNSYHTLKTIQFILPDGSQFDTSISSDYERFQNHEIGKTIVNLKADFLKNNELVEFVRQKYLTKNTVGYGLNAFLNFEHPLDIFAHLLIGAEGTLAFISEAVMETVVDFPEKATAMLYFDSIYEACKAIIPLKNDGCDVVELMDYASLKSIENLKGAPEMIKNIPFGAAALLIEYQDLTIESLKTKAENAKRIFESLKLLSDPQFTYDAYEQSYLWKLRKGMFPAVGAVRERGTTVILEDVAFPLEHLADAVIDCQLLFKKHKYENAIIFGHAKDGNIHFVVTQHFNGKEAIAQYENFMQDVVELVVKKYHGTLKAEHGTGRNMAPFVETEWGTDAYEIMKTLKQAADPHNLLNPGVIINEDKKAHLKNLKQMPEVEPIVDKCIECGYCEHKCPSKDLTLSPRRRIVARRELALLKQNGKNKEYSLLQSQYQYFGLDTCAVDGLCATDCPVDINTGELVKQLRKENHSSIANAIAVNIAKNFKTIFFLAHWGVKFGNMLNAILCKNFMLNTTKLLKKGFKFMPLWSNQIKANKSVRYKSTENQNFAKSIIYFPSCICRAMGEGENGKKSVTETFYSVAQKAGYNVIVPSQVNSLCCGQPFSSKGFSDAFQIANSRTLISLNELSKSQNLEIVCDLSSCSQTLINSVKNSTFGHLIVKDVVDFIFENALPNIEIKQKANQIVLHPVCSLQKMGNYDKFSKAAQKLAKEVTIPKHAGCCGMAGDRGFWFPELTQSATRSEAKEVITTEADGYYCSSKTCEMALTEATGKNYENLLYLVDELS